jgi:hypothetical protein
MKDTLDKARLTKLLEALKEQHGKTGALIDEINEVLGGGVGMAAKIREFDIAWTMLWQGRYHSPYQFNRTKDMPHVKRLIKAMGVEELVRRATNYLRNDDPFYTRARHAFGVFVASVNTHVGEPAPTQDFELAAPTGCKHTPPCASDAAHTSRKSAEMRAAS